VQFGMFDNKLWIIWWTMSGPRRRIQPPPKRGRKGEKKRKKQNSPSHHPNVGLSMDDFKEKFANMRRELILDESNEVDKSQLLEPSSLFSEKTQNIRVKPLENINEVILLNDPVFKLGLDSEIVKAERERVLKGEKTSHFKGLPKELTEQRKILSQQQRKHSPNLLAKATLQQRQSRTEQPEFRSDPLPEGEVVEQLVTESEMSSEVETDKLDEITNFSILPELRNQLSAEPQPEEFMIRVLRDEYKFDKKSIKTLIQHVASPFSVCKSMSHEPFRRFLFSSFSDDSVNAEDNDWGHLFEQLGQNTPNHPQLIEIRELLGASHKKLDFRCRVVAFLYYFAPERFAGWWNHPAVPGDVQTKMEADFTYFEQQGFSQQAIEHARMLVCSFAIEKPKEVATRYTYARHQSGAAHESKTEKWLKKGCADIEYLTESEIKKGRRGRTYGGKRVHPKISPDILLSTPVKLTANGQPIHWIDAKKQFIDPSFSPDDRITQFCDQMKKYVDAYGPGMVVWGKDFSEEWNVATKDIVLHIKI
jgi:hypothetical protein